MITTTETKISDSSRTAPAAMETWDMACAVLTALHQTHQQAQDDYTKRFNAAGGKPFAPGVNRAVHLIETLEPALRELEADMRRHARANGLAVPDLER